MNSSTNNTEFNSCAGDPNVPDFWIGVFASLVGSVILNLGLNLQKYAFNTRGDTTRKTGIVAPPIYTNKIWVLGFAVFVCGNFGDFVGLTFTPQSVITPIGSISLVSNLFFAKCLLGEEIGCKTMVAIFFIMSGVIAIVLSSSNANPCGSLETIDSLLKRWEQGGFLIFAILHALALMTILFFVVKTERKLNGVEQKKDENNTDAAVKPNDVLREAENGSTSTKKSEVNKPIPSLANLSPKEQLFLRFAYPLLGSLFATWTVLLSKSTGELLKSSARAGKSQFTRFEVWPIIIGLVVSLPCQIIYLNKGLSWFEALYIVPIFYSVWVISSIMMGALYFGEFNNFTPMNFLVFFIGVFFDIMGGIMLQARNIDDKTDAKDNGPKEDGKTSFSTGRGSDVCDDESALEMVTVTTAAIDEEPSNGDGVKRELKDEEKDEENGGESGENRRKPERVDSKEGDATVWHVHPSKK